jgi:predicted short-subunit dehydrogenase-like oxidoreductase (DUF2520 family)
MRVLRQLTDKLCDNKKTNYLHMKVVFIGSGSVATHLALALQAKGVTISQIYSRTVSNAQILAERLGTTFTNDISDIYPDADIYIYAVKDSFLTRILSEMDLPDGIHVHTAGSISMIPFSHQTTKYGVFYIRFKLSRKNVRLILSEIPIFIEGSNVEVQQKLLELAKLISKKTFVVNSDQRKNIHLAAVFACNFTNYMYDIASQLIVNTGIGFDVLQPLIAETADKIKTLSPYDAQTGPAVRYDDNIIKKHIYLLRTKREFRRIYKNLSQGINKRHKTK